MNVETQQVETMQRSSWDLMPGIAQKQLDRTYKNHVLNEYQETLAHLDQMWNKDLKEVNSKEDKEEPAEF